MRRLTFIIIFAAACNSDEGDTSGGTMGEPDGVGGFLWCAQAEGARGHYQTSLLGKFIFDDFTGTWERGCQCYCLNDSNIMGAGLAGNLPPGPSQTWYDGQVAALRGITQGECADGVAYWEDQENDVLLFDGMLDVTCEEASENQDPFLASECIMDEDECPFGGNPIPGTGGEVQVDDTAADGGGPLVYGISVWGEVIDCPSSNACTIDTDFVAYLLDDLSVFSDDFIGVTVESSALSHRSFKFEYLGNDSLPAALGFQEDDYVWQLNGSSFYSIDHVTAAFEAFHDNGVFTVKVDRGMSTITKTFTIAQVNPTF